MISPDNYEKLMNEDIYFVKSQANARIKHLEAALYYALEGEEGEIAECMSHVIDTTVYGTYYPVKKEYEEFVGNYTI